MSKQQMGFFTYEELTERVRQVAAGIQAAVNGQPELAIAFVLNEMLRQEPSLVAMMTSLHDNGLPETIAQLVVPVANGGEA